MENRKMKCNREESHDEILRRKELKGGLIRK